MQRSRAGIVFAENQFRIALEQNSDPSQVAIPRRVMNLAAEGEAAPGQHGQRDGCAAGIW